MSNLVRKMQRRLSRSAGSREGIKLGLHFDAPQKLSACRGSRRGKHREGFSVKHAGK